MRQRLIVGLLTALAVVHAALVWPSYAVGSFDDDSSYLLAARALAHGATLNTRLPVGLPLAATYPPGYSALIAPLARVSGSSFIPERVLSLVLLGVLLPLVWLFLRRRGVGEPMASAVLALLALNPVLATYGVMVMAELPFLVVLLGVLLAVERWDAGGGRWAAAVTAVGCGALLLLKEAGLGVVAGVVLWLLIRPHWTGRAHGFLRLRWHRPGRAVFVGAVTLVLLAPVVASRLTTHSPLAGARYSSEIGGPATGGVIHRLTSGLPGTLSAYGHQALPDSVVPTRWAGSPFPQVSLGWAYDLVIVLVSVFVVLGAVVWQRRFGGVTLPVLVLYFLETLAFPYTNERRVILVLPLVVIFLVTGVAFCLTRAATLPAAVTRPAAAAAMRRTFPARAGVVGALTVWVVVLLVAQFDRDYLFPEGGHSSTLRGSRYLSLLSAAAQPGDLVETDFVWTVALETGLQTSGAVSSLAPAFSPLVQQVCDPAAVAAAVTAERADFLVSGSFVNAGIGSPCVLSAVTAAPYAVRLLRTATDAAAIFELIGPGTGHPDLRDLTSGAESEVAGQPTALRQEPAQATEEAGYFPVATATPGGTAVTEDWKTQRPVTQVSVGAVTPEPADPAYPAEPGPGAISSTRVQLREGGRWVDVATSAGRVDDYGPRPYLLVHPAAGTLASGVRVLVSGSGTVGVHDLHVLGR